MNVKFTRLLRALLTYWGVNLVIIGLLTFVGFAICIPLVSFLLTGKILFSEISLIDIVQFVFVAAFLTGSILWLKEEVLRNHD